MEVRRGGSFFINHLLLRLRSVRSTTAMAASAAAPRALIAPRAGDRTRRGNGGGHGVGPNRGGRRGSSGGDDPFPKKKKKGGYSGGGGGGGGGGGRRSGHVRRTGKAKLPAHVLEKVKEKARLRRIDERAHFWAEVEAALTGVGGARSHGRCLPDTEEELFPRLSGGVGAGEHLGWAASGGEGSGDAIDAYDDIPVTVEDPLSADGSLPPTFPLAEGPEGLRSLSAMLPEPWPKDSETVANGLNELRDTIERRMGFAGLTPIQRHAVPLAFAGRDLICSAATGSGKTAAYLIPAVAKVLASESPSAAELEAASVEEDEDEGDDWEVIDPGPATGTGRGGYGRRRRAQGDDKAVDLDVDIMSDIDSLFNDEDGEEGNESASSTESPLGSEEDLTSLPNGGVTPARPRILVLVPTRELAAQVTLQARRIAFNTGLKTALLHGGQSVKPQLEQLAQGPDIVVSTPGRLLTCANDEPYLDLSRVTTLVIDEADQMLDMGFEPQISEILHRSAMPPPAPAPAAPGAPRVNGRQSLMFSATFPGAVERLARALVIGGNPGGYVGIGSGRADIGGPGSERRAAQSISVYGEAQRRALLAGAAPPARVAVGRVGSTVAGIEQRIVLAENLRERKFELLVAALRAAPEARTLVFCAGKGTVAWVRAQLQRLLEEDARNARAAAAMTVASGGNTTGADDTAATSMVFAAEELHGDCSQGARSRALDAFATGACRVLVATDVASRGLDLPEVRHVINFDLPVDSRDFDAYVHRIGRTGRAGRAGLATSFYVPGYGGDGNGPVYRPLMELLLETGQVVPEWFEASIDKAGPPPGGRGYMREGRGRGRGGRSRSRGRGGGRAW